MKQVIKTTTTKYSTYTLIKTTNETNGRVKYHVHSTLSNTTNYVGKSSTIANEMFNVFIK